MIDMVEPTDPAERALAVKICRANAHLDPDTGKRNARTSKAFWDKGFDLPYRKWIWLWNYGQEEWDPDCSGRDSGSRNAT